MESSIKNSIDARKNAIYNSYTNLSQNYKEKVETLFNKINELVRAIKEIRKELNK